MGTDKSIDDLVKEIKENRERIINAFLTAYSTELSHVGIDFSIEDICLIEQEPHFRDGCATRRYWFELKPKFGDFRNATKILD